MTTALLVYSHIDDAEIFGFPWFQDRTIDRRVLICSNDRTNPARQSYAKGIDAFTESCRIAGIPCFVAMEFWSEFYRLRTRGPGDGPILNDWWNSASALLSMMSKGCDFIATHGPIDYGHMDHLLVRRMVLSTTKLPVRWTDAFYQTQTWPIGDRSRLMDCGMRVGEATLDVDLHEKLKHEYVSRGAWTWDHEVPTPVSIYEEQ